MGGRRQDRPDRAEASRPVPVRQIEKVGAAGLLAPAAKDLSIEESQRRALDQRRVFRWARSRNLSRSCARTCLARRSLQNFFDPAIDSKSGNAIRGTARTASHTLTARDLTMDNITNNIESFDCDIMVIGGGTAGPMAA